MKVRPRTHNALCRKCMVLSQVEQYAVLVVCAGRLNKQLRNSFVLSA